jgi:hypothetical protein
MARTFDSPQHDVLREFLIKKRKEAGYVELISQGERRPCSISWISDKKAEAENAHSCDPDAHETIRQSHG